MSISQPSKLPALVTQIKTSTSPKAESGPSASTAAKTSAAQSPPAAGVALTVSAQARELEQSGFNSAAEVNTQKVATVRAAVQGGTYTVNAEAIADKLLSNAQEMLKRTPR